MRYLLLFLVAFLSLFGMQAQTQNLFDVARTGTAQQAETLLKADPKLLNTPNADGFTALILACYKGNNAVAMLLLEKGADVNAMSGMGTALMASVVKGNAEMVTNLISHKADPNLADGNGMTAILYAVMFKKHEMAKQLMAAGADPAHKDSRGQSALDYAVLANDDQLIEILKSHH